MKKAMKNIRTYSITKTKPKAMKKIPLVFAILCTFTLLSFNACSPGYGCFYSASETISEQPESLTIEEVDPSESRLSEKINCLP